MCNTSSGVKCEYATFFKQSKICSILPSNDANNPTRLNAIYLNSKLNTDKLIIFTSTTDVTMQRFKIILCEKLNYSLI